MGFLLDGIREGVLLHGGGCEQSAGLPAVVGLFVLFETAAGGPLVSLRSTSLRLACGKSTAAQLYPVLTTLAR